MFTYNQQKGTDSGCRDGGGALETGDGDGFGCDGVLDDGNSSGVRSDGCNLKVSSQN